MAGLTNVLPACCMHIARDCVQVRDAFRRFMAASPDAWDYSSSDIPSPLTQEMEEAQQSKKVSHTLQGVPGYALTVYGVSVPLQWAHTAGWCCSCGV